MSKNNRPLLVKSTDYSLEDDKFDRQKTIEFLTSLLEEVEGGFVFNIDSAWGTGKTFFLKK